MTSGESVVSYRREENQPSPPQNKMFRDYKIDPQDSGEFLNSYEIEFEFCGENGIYTFDKVSQNPKPHLKYFCRVGGGYQGFKKKVNARNFLNQPD